MSWSITINNLPDYSGFDEFTIEKMVTQHILYPFDMQLALDAAKKAGLKSAVLGGGRTISPYTGEEVVTITITGMSDSTDFNAAMKRIVVQSEGPGNERSNS